MPAPTAAERDKIEVSWLDIINAWDTIVSDLYATYGTAVDTVQSWLDFRRMIIGLMGRKTSMFAVSKALEAKAKTEV